MLGDGHVVTVAFATPGLRIITATATDSSGLQTSRSVPFTATNPAPVAVIEAPVGGAQRPSGGVLVLRGRGEDGNHGPGSLPCDRLVWSIDRRPTWHAIGCTATTPVSLLGPAVIRLHVADPYGLTHDARVTVEFVPGPTSGPPQVVIAYPGDGAILGARLTHTLTGAAIDPDGTPVGLFWFVNSTDGPTIIGVGATVQFTPIEAVPARCGRRDVQLELHALDGDAQSAVKTVTVTLEYGPC